MTPDQGYLPRQRLGQGLGAGCLESPGVSPEERRGWGGGGVVGKPSPLPSLDLWLDGDSDIKSSEASLPASQDGGVREIDIPREGRG